MRFLLFLFPVLIFANGICQSEYYKGIKDTILFRQYENGMEVPQVKWWGVIDVSDFSQAEIIALGIKLKKDGFNPVVVRFHGRNYILVYASNSKEDVKNSAKLPYAKVKVVPKPKEFEKIYFSSLCIKDNYVGVEGIEKLLMKIKALAKANLDTLKYVEFKKYIDKAKEILIEKDKATEEKEKELLKDLFGGD